MAQDAIDGGVVDAGALGRRIRAARVLAGFDHMGDLTAAVRELGLQVSDRTLYALERGQQPVTWELLVALVLAMRPPGGMRFFWPAVASEHRAGFVALNNETEEQAAAREATTAYLVARTEAGDDARRRA